VAPKPISAVYLINLPHQLVCMRILLSLLCNSSAKRYRGDKYTEQQKNYCMLLYLCGLSRIKESGRLIVVVASCNWTYLTNNQGQVWRMALVPTRTTRRNIPEHAVLHSHRRENLKSYKGRFVLHCACIIHTYGISVIFSFVFRHAWSNFYRVSNSVCEISWLTEQVG
jgi:hypothetical protein